MLFSLARPQVYSYYGAMRQTYHPDLLAEIAAFCAARGLSKTAFGRDAVGDPNFVMDVESGRECRRATIARVRSFIAAYGSSA